MTDLERALRDTLADPPVQVPANGHATYDIERRIERRRSRQKRTATGLGVAAVIAAAIAVPVATGVDLGSGSNSSRSHDLAANGDARGSVHGENVVPQPAGVPAQVRNAAQALARDYGRPSRPVEWVRTSAAAWDRLRHQPGAALSAGPIYVLQFRDLTCTTARCPADTQGTGPQPALVATVRADGHIRQVTFVPPYDLATLGTVHTFTVR